MIDKNELLIQKIDIDISDCMYLDGNYCPNHDTKCDFVDNCYFREYKRKMQECEELKKEQLEIKKYLGISSKTILERLEELQERRDELSEKNLSYEQALEEIEEVWAKDEDGDYDFVKWQILDIINKAKDRKQCKIDLN